MKVTVLNVSSAPAELDEVPPELIISRLNGPYGVPVMTPWPLQKLAGRRLQPGEQVVEELTLIHRLDPGWYRASTSMVHFRVGDRTPGVGSSDGRFVVPHPPGTGVVGVVEPGGESTVNGYTLALPRVEFSEREMKIHFRISHVKAPAGSEFFLTLPDGTRIRENTHAYRDRPGGGIEGWVQFDPLPAHYESIDVEMPRLRGLQSLEGPWRVRVPLPVQGTPSVLRGNERRSQ